MSRTLLVDSFLLDTPCTLGGNSLKMAAKRYTANIVAVEGLTFVCLPGNGTRELRLIVLSKTHLLTFVCCR